MPNADSDLFVNSTTIIP